MYMFNFNTDITGWFSHNSLYLIMTKTGNIIFSRSSYHLSITHSFLLSIPTSKSITNIGFIITYHLDNSKYMNMIRTVTYVLYNLVISDGHDHKFSRSPIVDQFRRSFSNDRRSSIFLLDHFLTIVDRRSSIV